MVSDGIVLVSMALCAASGEAQPGRTRGRHPIGHGVKAKFVRVDAAFFVEHGVAMKPGGNALRHGCVRQHVASELFDRKLVEGHAGIDRANYPVAIRPDAAWAILLIAVGTEAPFLVLAGDKVSLDMNGRYIRLPYHGTEGHKTIGNWYTTLLNAHGNPIEHYGDLDLEMSRKKLDQSGSIKQLMV